ncbi:MAG: hypothetical protein LBL81_04795, partial [Tannerella sp.]|nr:hypothetical protein [Tannerella sp.]
MNGVFSKLIKEFDCIGWIPTVRGGFSIRFFDYKEKSSPMMGDIDKYAISFKTYDGFKSIRYFIASSLYNCTDSKWDRNYVHTFRFIFRATTNNEEMGKQLGGVSYSKGKFLVGKLTIVPQFDTSINLNPFKREFLKREFELKDEANLIHELQGITKEKLNFDKLVNSGGSCDNLEGKRTELKRHWDYIESIINRIDNITDKKHCVYKFDVIL